VAVYSVDENLTDALLSAMYTCFMSHLLVLVLVLVSRELVMVSVSVLLQPGLDYNTASSLVILGLGLGLDKCDLIDITESGRVEWSLPRHPRVIGATLYIQLHALQVGDTCSGYLLRRHVRETGGKDRRRYSWLVCGTCRVGNSDKLLLL